MSSEAQGFRARPATRDRGALTRRLVGTIVVLAVIAGGFAFASVMQGPRVNAGEIDALRATRLAGVELTLEVNQPVAAFDADAVSVEPGAEVTADAADRTITVTFAEPLDYATEYTVRVPGVVGAFQGVPSTLEYRFQTPDEYAYTLQRRSDVGEADIVQRKALRGSETDVVFTAPRIQEFAHVDDLLVAVTLDDDDTNGLFVTDVRQGEPQEFGLLPGSLVRDLAASTTNPLAAFVLTTPEIDGARQYDNALMSIDLAGVAEAEPTPVLGLDGAPLKVSAWAFVPGSASVVVQDFENSMFLIDLLGRQPATPLGVHTEIRGFVPGTSDLVIADPDRGALIDLGDGTTTTLELASADLAENVYSGRITMLDDESRYLISLTSVRVEGGRNVLSSVLAEVDDSGELRQVFAPAAETSLIRGYCVSPNGKYVAVAASAEAGVADGYSVNPGFTETMTSIVEIATGRTVMSLSGGFSDWCGSRG